MTILQLWIYVIYKHARDIRHLQPEIATVFFWKTISYYILRQVVGMNSYLFELLLDCTLLGYFLRMPYCWVDVEKRFELVHVCQSSTSTKTLRLRLNACECFVAAYLITDSVISHIYGSRADIFHWNVGCMCLYSRLCGYVGEVVNDCWQIRIILYHWIYLLQHQSLPALVLKVFHVYNESLNLFQSFLKAEL